MHKFLLSAVLLASLSTAAAQQPAEGERSHMPMAGTMMQNCPMAGAMMSSVDVKYEATETGARLMFTPKDPKQLGELQTMIREMAERMGKGGGSMMGMHGMMGNPDREDNHDIHHPAK